MRRARKISSDTDRNWLNIGHSRRSANDRKRGGGDCRQQCFLALRKVHRVFSL
jgi:hypothetical protein